MIVATHNLMHGHQLGRLVEDYRSLARQRGLDVLCIQENGRKDGAVHSAVIAGELDGDYVELSAVSCCGKGLIYDRSRLRCVEHQLHELPALASLGWLERRYIAGGVPDQRFLQVVRFEIAPGGEPAGERSLSVINFHLDTAGGNRHRRRQVEAIAEIASGLEGTVIVCGDTNAFCVRRRRHPRVLDWMLKPLAEGGILATEGDEPTHFFARQDEPKLAHQLVMRAARLGFERALRYDVMCTNGRAADTGVLSTPGSDHDLVWMSLDRGDGEAAASCAAAAGAV